MKNLITTLGGAVLAAILIVVKLVSTHMLDPETIAIAGVVAFGGVMLSDNAIIGFFKSNQIADGALELGDTLTGNSNNSYLKAIHGLLSSLDEKVNGLPDAVAAAVPTPISVDASTTNNAAPAAEAPPVAESPIMVEAPVLIPNPPGAKFDVNTGAPLSTDGAQAVSIS